MTLRWRCGRELRSPRRRARGRALAALAVLGAALLAQGLWIPAKAVLAQELLERAWARRRAGEPAPRPWPWADTWPVARLVAPASGVRAIVLAGASGRTLAFGPGHLAGSAPPGAAGHSVVAGHRDTHFAFLRGVVPGDLLEVERPDGRLRTYRVTWAGVVHERDTRWLAPSARPALTLVTCYPFDAARPGGPLRWLVHAEAAGQPASPATPAARSEATSAGS